MKILSLCADFGIPVRGFKGASVHVRALADAWRQLGHEVHIITANAGEGNTTRAEVEEVTPPRYPPAVVTALRRLGTSLGRGPRLEHDLREWHYNARLVQVLQQLCATWHPDVIYERYSLFSMAGTRLAQRLGVPLVLEVNAPLRQERRLVQGLALPELARWCERRILRNAELIVCVSQGVGDYVIAQRADPARVVIQPNGVDLTTFHRPEQRESMRRQLGLQPDEVVVGFTGSLKSWHGVEQLIMSAAHVHAVAPQLRLMIVGDGPAYEAIRAAIAQEEMGPWTILTGAVPHQQVPAYLAAMDICAAPYIAREDFYFSPLKVFEYLAAGKPVVAPRIGQIAEIMDEDGAGVLYDPTDPTTLTSALGYLATHADVRAALGAAAMATAANHSWEQNAKRILALVQHEPSPIRPDMKRTKAG